MLEIHSKKQMQVSRDCVMLFKFCSFMRVKHAFPVKRVQSEAQHTG